MIYNLNKNNHKRLIDLSQEAFGMISRKKEEYLSLRKKQNISQSDYELLENSIIDNKNLGKLFETVNNVKYNLKSFQYNIESVGCILPLTYLIESKFSMNREKIKEIKDKYIELKPYIFNYRQINKDANSFYRAVMFRYFEILILKEKIDALRNVVNDMVNSFNSEELKKITRIKDLVFKPDLSFKILLLIVSLLNYKQKEKAHEILVKSFSTSKKFEYSLILYFRYILYDYIKKNENRIYSKGFPIKLGNLLPIQYRTDDGKFSFNSFYRNNLLNFNSYIENIVIYLTPLVLGIELNVINFEYNNEKEILQKYKLEENPDLSVNDVISLINNKNHFEIIYNLKDYEQYKNIFVNYENNLKSEIIANMNKLLKEKEIEDSINFNKVIISNNENLSENQSNQIKSDNNKILLEKILKLEKELKIEKIKNKNSEEIIKELNNKLRINISTIQELNNKIKIYESKKITNENSKMQRQETKILYERILQREDEIIELKKKLSRFPFELKENEKLMCVNFRSIDQKIQNYSLICKNTDSFNVLENQLYKDNKEYYETENYFTVNGKKIHKNKTLEENNIHNNDTIILNVLEI